MSLATADIDFLRGLIRTKSGQVITDSQSYLFDSKLESVVTAEGLSSVKELVAAVRKSKSPRISDNITEAMTINETFFFRDVHPFEALRSEIIPRLMEQKSETKSISVWAAACSSGQEPYSIAMVLSECFARHPDWKITVLATDISDETIEKAEKGEFTQFEVNRGLPVKSLIKHFDRRGSSWFIKDELRSMVRFRKVNLSKPWPIYDKFDVVFLRNVLIYFDPETKGEILRRIRSNLTDDGYLFLGGGESLLKLNAPFSRESLENSVCFRPTQ